jgi:Na+/H+ antiporter NhaC
MLWHEVAGVAIAVISGAVAVSALSKNSDTANIAKATLGGFAGLVDTVTAPARSAGQ